MIKKNGEYYRCLVFSRLPLSGYYRYEDKVQIYPAPPSWKRPPALRGDHPILLEVKTSVFEKSSFLQSPIVIEDAPGLPPRIAWEDFISLLSTLTNYSFFAYGTRQSWFIPLDDRKFEKKSIWGQETYIIPDDFEPVEGLQDPNCERMTFVDATEYFNAYARRLATEPISFPTNFSQLLKPFIKKHCFSKKIAVQSFRKAAKLFHTGVHLKDKGYLSVAFASFVSSLETLIAYDHRKKSNPRCKECGQKVFAVRKKFRQFFSKYGSDSREAEKYANKIYDTRSRFLHEGQFLLSEIDETATYLLDSVELEYLIRTCRLLVVNWLINNIVA